ncbi:hypothetical protein AQUCO_03500025v1 [Aquilegia coerulea]|uniref:Uncharacterized protein n=2 Tax=Aquilegia coerulea TaxID=218851 RepID=A0A2G5CVR2_AQUCA|nr:hypothetical protein AQUCO_03500025v1 [Aquilegia coerulea]
MMKTLLSNAWLPRCKRLQESVVVIFMDVALNNAALDSDDLLYLKEQMEAEEDAERLLRRTEKRAFAAFKKAASLADSLPAAVPLPLRVEPKPKSGIRQQDLLKNIVEIRPKRHRVSSPSDGNQPTSVSSARVATNQQSESDLKKERLSSSLVNGEEEAKEENPIKSLLGLAYESSEDEED